MFTFSEQWRNKLLMFILFPDKPNSADESQSEDTRVAKTGRENCFREEWLCECDWLKYLRVTNTMNCKFCSRYPQHAGNIKFEGNAGTAHT